MRDAPPPPLILASISPRRRQLLARLAIPFEVVPSGFDESGIDHGDPVHFAREAARCKCLDVARRMPDSVVIGSDTVVCFRDDDGPWRILGKPADEADARRMLSELSGRTHRVVTGVAVAHRGMIDTQSVASDVRFRHLEEGEIAEYVATGEPMDKAGAYGIQDLGVALVESVRGDLNTVIGFPLALVSHMLGRYYPGLTEAPEETFLPGRE